MVTKKGATKSPLFFVVLLSNTDFLYFNSAFRLNAEEIHT